PILSAVLVVAWLLLSGFTPAQLVLGMLFGVLMPWITRRFFDEPFGHLRGVRAAGRAFTFTLLVLWDIVIANVVVARLVLGPPGRLRPAFIEVPLEIEQPLAIALLGCIITMTPGTVSSEISADRRRLLVHVLDAPDPDAVVRQIKARYEQRLKEIFA
ncbi:MAG TPA: Na+/H+ antiporter subunit E, partial [Burkholderiales bacterium]|nr:Na+/H+ antiporter subunit E [Burkholderiales bacterium]